MKTDLPPYLTGPLPALIVAAAAVFGLALWGNHRRSQNRHHHPQPLPPIRPTLILGAKKLFTGATAIPGVALVAATAAATVYFGGIGLAAGLLALAGLGYLRTRRTLALRDAWTATMFQVTAEHIGFPEGASPARWIFPQGWAGEYPRLVLIRCPDDFNPANHTAARLVSLAWNNDPVLSARREWAFEIGPQLRHPDKHQVIAHPTPTGPKPDSADPLTTLTRTTTRNSEDPDKAKKLGARIRAAGRALKRAVRVLLPIAAATYLIWRIARDPAAAWHWATTHPAIPAIAAALMIAGLVWFWARMTIFAKRQKPKKGMPLMGREFYGLTVWEDRWYVRVPMLAAGIAAFYIAATTSNPTAGFVALGAWLILAIVRYAIVARGRRRVLTDMYDIARTHLDYERHWKLRRGQRPVGLWRRISVSWGAAARPGVTEAAFPTGFKTSSWKIMSAFYEEWTQKAFPPNGNRPGLEWEFDIDLANKVIRCTPYIPVDPRDVRIGEALPATLTQFLGGRITRTGDWCILDLKTSPHMLVCGDTGGGKSATMEAYVYQKARTPGWEIQVADAGGSGGWARWEGRPNIIPAVADGEHACIIALSYPQIGAMMAGVRREMDRRKQLLVHYKVSSIAALPAEIRPSYRLVACDEWLTLLSTMTKKAVTDEEKANKQIAEQVWSDWSYVILEGRKVGIHSITGAQRPDAQMFGGALRDNIGIRICAGWMTETGLRMMFGETYRAPADFVGIEGQGTQSGKDLPRGRQLVRPGSGKPVVVVQGPWFGGEDNDEDLIRYLPVTTTAADGQPTAAAPPLAQVRPTDTLVGVTKPALAGPPTPNAKRTKPSAEQPPPAPPSPAEIAVAKPPAPASADTNPFLPVPATKPADAGDDPPPVLPRRQTAATPVATVVNGSDDPPPPPPIARRGTPAHTPARRPPTRLPRFEDDES